MTKKEIKNAIFDVLTPELKKLGFKPQKGKDRFVRPTEFGAQNISYHIVDLGHKEVTFFYSLRFEKIEELWHKVSDVEPSFQDRSTTLHLIQDELDKNENIPHEYVFNTEEELNGIFELVLLQHIPVAQKMFFDKVATLEDVDRIINQNVTQEILEVKPADQRCMKGIGVAYLINRDDLDEVIVAYQNQMADAHTRVKTRIENLISIVTN